MNNYQVLSIKEIIVPYQVLLIDIWGVVYNGVGPYEGAVECLNKMIEDGKRVIFLSNNPRKYTFAKEKLSSFGIDMQKASIYTSGDAVREQLLAWNDDVFKNLGRKLYHLGEARNKEILADIKVDVTTDIKQADFLLITAYLDEGEDLNVYDHLLKEAADLKIPAICANPDVAVPQGDSIRYCAGMIGKLYEEMGGIVHYYGKPDVRMFNAVLNKYLSDYDKSKILMIGDTIDTDILGANRANLDSALVLTGNGRAIAEEIKAGTADIFAGLPAKPTWITYGMGL